MRRRYRQVFLVALFLALDLEGASVGGAATLPDRTNQAATSGNVGVTGVTQSPAAGSAWPELKVDLSRSTQRSDTAAPHFIEWQFDPASPARTYGNVGVLLRR
ncbi:MAG: hypothetical protein ABI318_03550, partial [Chthoniobacteraceae bacterium]